MRAVAYTSALAPTLEALGYVAIAIVAGVGGILMLQGQTLGGDAVTLGLIITFIGFVQRFNQPIAQIAIMWANIQSAIAGAERIFDLLDVMPDIQERFDAQPMPQIQGHVVFDHVTAEYKQGEPVLKDINLEARAGADDRHRRAHGRRQDHARQPAAAFLRRDRRRRDDRRRRRALGDAGKPAPPDRRRACRTPSCLAIR